MLNKKLLTIVLASLMLSVVGCGQKGPLYEPLPVEINDTEKSEIAVTENETK